MTRLTLTLLTGLAVSLTGCGDGVPNGFARETLPVSIGLTYKGQPAPDAVVVFHPVTRPDDDKPFVTPRGIAKPDGTLEVTTYERGDGVPPGEYRLAFSWQGPLDGLSEDQIDELAELMPQAYCRPETSGHTIVVAEDASNEFPPIEL